MVLADDFAENGSDGAAQSSQVSTEKKRPAEKRAWLKVYETLPCQMLNAYGPAKFAKLSDETVWAALSEPLKSGGMYMTELCSMEPERRGVGINRMLHAMKLYCEYQKTADVMKQNKAIIKEAMYDKVYQEIENILPHLEYCLAPKKQYTKAGSSALRSSGLEAVVSRRSDSDLDAHAKALYEGLQTNKISRLRMLVHWQSAGGMSFVAGCHHRAAQCFRYFGEALHEREGKEVSLTAFQNCIKERHRLGSAGFSEDAAQPGVSSDFDS